MDIMDEVEQSPQRSAPIHPYEGHGDLSTVTRANPSLAPTSDAAPEEYALLGEAVRLRDMLADHRTERARLQEDVEAADLEDWRADAARLYPMGEDDFLPGMNVDVSEPGASISPAGMDDDDDDDDDEWFDDDLD